MSETSTRKPKTKQRIIFDKIFVFAKAQISAFIGGISDWSIMVFVTEVFHVHYTISIAIGGIVGAIINFGLNKSWTFRTKDIKYKHSTYKQMFRFFLVVINSIFMKSSGTYLVTTYFRLDYKISRILIDLFVSLAFNYTFQRFWVFKKENQ